MDLPNYVCKRVRFRMNQNYVQNTNRKKSLYLEKKKIKTR